MQHKELANSVNNDPFFSKIISHGPATQTPNPLTPACQFEYNKQYKAKLKKQFLNHLKITTIKLTS